MRTTRWSCLDQGSVEDEIAKPNAYLATDKARHELGFDPSFRVTGGLAGNHSPSEMGLHT